VKPFANEPTLELRRKGERDALSAALAGLRLPVEVPVLISADRRPPTADSTACG
jgi:hypothetical protein